eukprot:UN22949
MKLSFFFVLVAISFARPLKSLEKKNQELSKTNGVLLQALRELTTSNEGQAEKAVSDWDSLDGNDGAFDFDSEDRHSGWDSAEKAVAFGKYKCLKRNDCIAKCQDGDSSKTWYACMKECPKSLCDKEAESESMDPEDEEDSEEEAVGLTCSVAGFEGTVTTDSWCDKRDGVWMHKCSSCKHGYYWYWWHTYCCTRGKGGCTCAYN